MALEICYRNGTEECVTGLMRTTLGVTGLALVEVLQGWHLELGMCYRGEENGTGACYRN